MARMAGPIQLGCVCPSRRLRRMGSIVTDDGRNAAWSLEGAGDVRHCAKGPLAKSTLTSAAQRLCSRRQSVNCTRCAVRPRSVSRLPVTRPRCGNNGQHVRRVCRIAFMRNIWRKALTSGGKTPSTRRAMPGASLKWIRTSKISRVHRRLGVFYGPDITVIDPAHDGQVPIVR